MQHPNLSNKLFMLLLSRSSMFQFWSKYKHYPTANWRSHLFYDYLNADHCNTLIPDTGLKHSFNSSTAARSTHPLMQSLNTASVSIRVCLTSSAWFYFYHLLRQTPFPISLSTLTVLNIGSILQLLFKMLNFKEKINLYKHAFKQSQWEKHIR